MGFNSIVGFYSKLAAGTAQMTTSRQAYRLGTQLSLGRLFGFYYAHIGFYLNQLHFGHFLYGSLALAFLGVLFQECGITVNTAAPSSFFADLFSWVFLLFVCGTVVPLFFVLLVENGPVAASRRVLAQQASGAAIFYSVLNRSIAHYFANELSAGGGKYVATGRGLALSHQLFSQLYTSYRTILFYPALDLAIMFVTTLLLSSIEALHMLPRVIFSIIIVGLLWGPAMFNPRAFEFGVAMKDALDWAQWLVKSGGNGWEAHYIALVKEQRDGVDTHSFVLPSKEMLMSFPLVLNFFAVSRTLHDEWWEAAISSTLLILPLAPIASGLLSALVISALTCRGSSLQWPTWLLPAVLLACYFAAETVVIALYLDRRDCQDVPCESQALRRELWCAFISARYFTWRWMFNALAYLAHGAERRACDGCCVEFLTTWKHHSIHGICWLSDLFMGILLQLPVALVAVVPLYLVHNRCLLRVSTRNIGRAAESVWDLKDGRSKDGSSNMKAVYSDSQLDMAVPSTANFTDVL